MNRSVPNEATDKDVQILRELFSSYASRQHYRKNQYIWNIFKAFITDKRNIEIRIFVIVRRCTNKNLLQLILSDIVKMERNEEHSEHVLDGWKLEEEEYLSDKYKNANLLTPEILSIFKNVTHLRLTCFLYPLSLQSLLSLINDTQIKEVEIFGKYWIPKVKVMSSFTNILSQYKKANFNIQVVKDTKCTAGTDKITIKRMNK